MAFYQVVIDKTLRFGDVIYGFISSLPNVTTPSIDNKHIDYILELSMPEYCVILSPCCSIGDSTLTLTPLEKIKRDYFTNPYFKEDLTNINRKLPPERAISPEIFSNLSPEEKQKKFAEGLAYTFAHIFIYGENPILPRYEVRLKGGERIETGYYLIDFRKTFRVYCQKIKGPEDSPVETKLLQLTTDTRQELRDKISNFYSRQPDEDFIVQQSV